MTAKQKKTVPLSEEAKTVIRIAADVGALHWPGREPFAMAREQVRFERRREYRQTGLAITGGGTAAERQEFGRRLQTLAAAGLLEINTSAARREGVRLTPYGDAVVRRMVGMFTVAAAWPLLEILATWQDEFGERSFPEHLPIAEEWASTDEQGKELEGMRQALIPLLAAGYVKAHGDGRPIRCYWLRVTPSGLAALDEGPPDDAPASIEFNQEAADLYLAEWDAYTAELDRAVPERPNNLCPPVSNGIGWGSLAAIKKWYPITR